MSNYLVYCLVSSVHPTHTYVGITNNWTRRIRQHQGFIKGGAVRTRAHRPWAPLFHITGLTKTQALQLEWAIKHKRRKGLSGPKGRIATIEYLLFSGEIDQWTSNGAKFDTFSPNQFQIRCVWTKDKYCSLCPKTSIPLHEVPFCERVFESVIEVPTK